jgi:hypothetical protein
MSVDWKKRRGRPPGVPGGFSMLHLADAFIDRLVNFELAITPMVEKTGKRGPPYWNAEEVMARRMVPAYGHTLCSETFDHPWARPQMVTTEAVHRVGFKDKDYLNMVVCRTCVSCRAQLHQTFLSPMRAVHLMCKKYSEERADT